MPVWDFLGRELGRRNVAIGWGRDFFLVWIGGVIGLGIWLAGGGWGIIFLEFFVCVSTSRYLAGKDSKTHTYSKTYLGILIS